MKAIWKYRPFFPILFILIVAGILRLYRIADYMTFLGDEGRDALVWLRMVREGKFTLIGPMTSIGNMYLGPLYYYLMLPFFLVFFLNPVGPSVGVALFSLATVFLIWWIGKQWFDEITGIIAAFLYAISPVVIVFSRSSWNPNVMPFFALLTIWGIWQFWQKKKFIWIPITGVALSFALQSHYLGLLLIPIVSMFWLATAEAQKRAKTQKNFLLLSGGAVLLFTILTIVPLVWFDLRHNFINYQAFCKFFTIRQETVNLKIYKAIPHLWPLWQMLVTRLLVAKEVIWGKVVALGLFIGMVFAFWRSDLLRGRTSSGKALILILAWLGVGLFGLGNYKQHIYDHYFGFLFPAPFFLTGLILTKVYQKVKFGKYIMIIILASLLFFSLKNSPLRESPNFQFRRVQEIDRKIVAESGEEPFNLALIAKQNYKEGYAFSLELWQTKLVEIDPARGGDTITEQLFVVCEDEECQPIGHSRAEIANFGWAEIADQWEFPWKVKLFKLTHPQ